MVGAVKPAGLSYVDRVNGDGALDALSFDADRCGGVRSAELVMSAPAFGAILGVVTAAAMWTALVGGRRR